MDKNEKLKEISGGESLRQVFKEVAADRSRGSRELTAYLLEEILMWSLERDRPTRTTEIETISEIIVNLRPEMAALKNFGYQLWNRYCQDRSQNKNLQDCLRRLRSQLERVDQEIVLTARQAELNDRDVLTFSRSSTILNLIKGWDRITKAVILHSHPGEEGIDLAVDLIDEVDVTFAYDVEAGYFLSKVDAIYLGADVILGNGATVNKTGSRLLADASDTTPVRVVADTWKLSPDRVMPEVPRYPSPEPVPDKLSRHHPIFESIPPESIDTYLTDQGIFHSAKTLMDEVNELKCAREKFSR